MTVEDFVEELVGEIYDETDVDLDTVVRNDDGSVVLPGKFPVHDLIDLDIDLPEGDYATVAGLVLEHLGRLPTAGESLPIDGWDIEIRTIVRHSIGEVLIRASDREPDEDE